MNNHHYGDISNLNAPYDAVPLQGLGQAIEPDEHPDTYPWMEYSEATLTMQQDLNEGLSQVGGCLLLEDGILGPRTCGALSYFVQQGAVSAADVPPACSAHASEAMAPTIPCTASATPSPVPIQEMDVMPSKGKVPGWLIGLGVGVVAIGVALALKKKKRR